MHRIVILMCFALGAYGPVAGQSILPSFGDSRTGTSGLAFLKIAPDAASTGMAGSYLAKAEGSAALFWNPAGITFLDSGQTAEIAANHTSYFADVNLSNATAIYRQSFTKYWGVSLTSLLSPEMEVTTEFEPNGNGQTYQFNNFALGLTYAQILTDQFRFGVTLRYAYEGFYNVETHNGLVDFGFQYDIGIRGLGFGVAVSNFGFNVRPDGSVRMLTLEGEQEADASFEDIQAPAAFRLGVKGDLYRQGDYAVLATAQLNHPTDNNETYALGVEANYKQLLYLRTGYPFATDENPWPSAGIGVQVPRRFGRLRFDYSYNNPEILEDLHRFSLGVIL